MKNNFEFLQNFLIASGDEIFICDGQGDILFRNKFAQKTYPQISNIKKISYLFNFDICILKSEDIKTYNPIIAALESSEKFTAEIIKQLDETLFAQYTITSFNDNNGQKIIVLRNDTNYNMSENYADLESRTAKLEKQIISSRDLKQRLENQLLKTKLINLVSEKVQKYISTEKILKITLEQLKKTLDIEKAEFSKEFYGANKEVIFETDKSGKILMRVPIYLDKKIYGIIVLYKKTQSPNWQKDEVELIKSVCAILSTSFAKEELYNEIENQKKELENTLSQLKQAQLQIVQSEKMASLGQLVAGIAHEINTPLGAVSSNLDLLIKLTQETSNIEDLKEFINEISPINTEALRRIENMVKTLKNFARLDEAQKKKVDLTEGLKSTLLLLNHEIKNRISVKENYAKLPLLLCYPDAINQVFMNILLNACQSIKNEGVIRITAKEENGSVIVSISDTGEGIPPSNLKKIFDFGFTTKKIGQGTGLGLALAKKIVEEHLGKIEVQSVVGKGTTFTVILPVL